MSYCSKCGAEIASDAGFCSKCGTTANPVAAAPAQTGANDTASVEMGATTGAKTNATTNAAKRPNDVSAWLLAIAPVPFVFAPMKIVWAIILLAGLDAHQLVKWNGYVDREQLLAKKGYKAISLRLWAFFLYPVYLYKRARLLDQKPIHLIACCAAFVLALILVAVSTSSGQGNKANVVQTPGEQSVAQEDTRIAAETPKKAVEPEAENAEAYMERAQKHLANGNYKRAIDECTSLIKLDPANPFGYGLRGSAYMGAELHDQAIADFTKNIQLAPEAGYIPYQLRGKAYFLKCWKLLGTQGENELTKDLWNKAGRDLYKALELAPDDASNIALTGIVLLGMGHRAEAQAFCARALSIDPSNKDARLLGTMLDRHK